MKNRTVFMFLLALFFLFFCIFCTVHPVESSQQIRVGLLPILDVLPIYVALDKGYFELYGLKLDIIPCASAAERDQLLVAGNLDIIINDLVSIALFNKEKTNVFGIRYAMFPTERFFQFALIAPRSANILKPQELKGVPIGVSQATIIHYVTERLLIKEGLKPDEIKIVAIPRIPDRLSALMRGDLKAACLPDPFASMAIIQGANLILDDRKYPFFSGSLYSVNKNFAEKNPDLIIRFLLSIDRAIADINKDKERFYDLAIEKRLIPSSLVGKYTIPDFPPKMLPDEKIWQDVISWLIEKDLIKKPIPYSDSITGKFLKK
ncbi:MAG: ABC transporter substrate-binding protein [Deltaproteobacteria bacterium]|nr:ABC transporter substrate-binding protein [Deltaproteobacteria bacterium]